MRRMLKFLDLFDLGIDPISRQRNHDLEVMRSGEIPYATSGLNRNAKRLLGARPPRSPGRGTWRAARSGRSSRHRRPQQPGHRLHGRGVGERAVEQRDDADEPGPEAGLHVEERWSHRQANVTARLGERTRFLDGEEGIQRGRGDLHRGHDATDPRKRGELVHELSLAWARAA
jgi:hypothetical protein